MKPARATVVDREIHLSAPYECLAICRLLPGRRWDGARKVWVLPATPQAARAVCDSFTGRLAADPALLALAATEYQPTSKEGLDEPIPLTNMKPWAHQVRVFNMIKRQAAVYIAHDMAVGKTCSVVNAIANLRPARVLVLCPTVVVQVWPSQIALHSPIPIDCVALRDPSGKTPISERIVRMNEAIKFHDQLRADQPLVIVLNYEALVDSHMQVALAKARPNWIVADEAHKLKSPSGVVSRAMARLGARAEKRIALSGTPMPHSPLDAYAQYRFLDPTIFGSSVTAFKARYCIMGGFSPSPGSPGVQVIGWRDMDDLNRRFYSIADRVIKGDVVDLPPVMHVARPVTLDEASKKLYRQLKEELIAEIAAGVVTAQNAMVKLLKLQEITSGHLKTDQGESQTVNTIKADAVAEILDDLDPQEPVAVFCRFRHDITAVDAVAVKAGRPCFRLYGGQNQLAEWKAAAGQGAVLAVQIQAGGLGVDMTLACYCILYSIGFSMGDYLQALARLDRPGQTRPVTYIHLVTQDTVDERIYKTLQARGNLVADVLGDLRSEMMPSMTASTLVNDLEESFRNLT